MSLLCNTKAYAIATFFSFYLDIEQLALVDFSGLFGAEGVRLDACQRSFPVLTIPWYSYRYNLEVLYKLKNRFSDCLEYVLIWAMHFLPVKLGGLRCKIEKGRYETWNTKERVGRHSLHYPT